jgi:hypothetical protein
VNGYDAAFFTWVTLGVLRSRPPVLRSRPPWSHGWGCPGCRSSWMRINGPRP